MRIKILRNIPPLPPPIITVLNNDQGFGQIKGTAKKLSIIYPGAKICVFKHENRQFLWETVADQDGKYVLRNLAPGLECFVVAFDQNNQYNALIQDGVIAK